jgi:hypothetical protein
MTPGEEIDTMIANHPDWRGARLASIRKTILDVDAAIVETWKWMGSPVWELGGILCVGNIYKKKVSIIFQNGASIADPDGLYNTQLEGNQRRGIDYFENDEVDVTALQALIRTAIEFNRSKAKK